MLLDVNRVSKGYPKNTGFFHRTWQPVLTEVSFQQAAGETLGLVGQSGSGKSTLARLICGIETADRGDILLNRQDVTQRKTRQGQIALVLQDYASSINPGMTVLQAVREALWQSDLSLRVQQEQVAWMLDKVGLSATLMPKYMSELSGGQVQRVAICRALINRPSLVVLDEPTSALDVVNQVQLLDVLQALKAEFQLSYFLISHNIQVLCYLCDRLLFLQQGRLVEECRTSALSQVKSEYAKGLLHAVDC